MEFKIIESYKNTGKTESMLHELSLEGWRVIGFDQYQILMERDDVDDTQLEGLFG